MAYIICGIIMEQTHKSDRVWIWNIQVTKILDEAVEQAVLMDSHVSKSEFVRDAVREKLRGIPGSEKVI